MQHLHALESIRLDACTKRELPGIHRDMHYVFDLLGESPIMGIDRHTLANSECHHR